MFPGVPSHLLHLLAILLVLVLLASLLLPTAVDAKIADALGLPQRLWQHSPWRETRWEEEVQEPASGQRRQRPHVEAEQQPSQGEEGAQREGEEEAER